MTFLKNLKIDPARVFLAAVTGPATPYAVDLVSFQGMPGSSPLPDAQHSCMAADGRAPVGYLMNVAACATALMRSTCDSVRMPASSSIWYSKRRCVFSRYGPSVLIV